MTRALFPLPVRPTAWMLATALLMPTVAPAGAAELNLFYEANWGGLHVADFALTLKNGGDAYENRFHLESRGMTRYLTNMAVRANSHGTIAPPPPSNGHTEALAPTFLAKAYRTEYTNAKHFRWMDIAFGRAGEPAQAVTGTQPLPGREDKWNPAEKGPEKLDKVEDQYLVSVSDPITMIPQMMALVRSHLTGGPKSFVMRGFDGRRRFDIDIDYLGLASRTIGDATHDTYHVRVTPKPIAGFKERHRILWNDSPFDFYLTHDERLVPLQIVPVNHGPIITLKAECPAECDVQAQDG